MILSIFKKSQPVSFIILPLALAIFWIIGSFRTSPGYELPEVMPLYLVVNQLTFSLPEFMKLTITFLIIFSQILHLNRIAEKHEILQVNSYLPALFFLMIIVSVPQFSMLHPAMFVNSLHILLIDKVFRLHKNQESRGVIFDSFFILAVSSLFYFPSLLLLLFLVASILILKPFRFKDWLIGLTGLATPYALCFAFFFLTDRLPGFIQILSDNSLTGWVSPGNFVLPVELLVFVLMLVAVIPAALTFISNIPKTVIRIRRFQQVIFLNFIVSLITAILSPEGDPARFMLTVPSLAIIATIYFLGIRKNWFAESLIWLFICLSVTIYILPAIS